MPIDKQEFISRVRSYAPIRKVVDFKNDRLLVSNENSVISIEEDGESYIVSDKALRAMSSWCGVPKRQFSFLDKQTLNRVIRESIVERELESTFKVFMSDVKEVQEFFPSSIEYLDLEKVVNEVEGLNSNNSINRIDMDLEGQDSIAIQVVMDEIEEGVKAGLDLQLYPTCNKSHVLSRNIWRVICANGLVDTINEKPMQFDGREIGMSDVYDALRVAYESCKNQTVQHRAFIKSTRNYLLPDIELIEFMENKQIRKFLPNKVLKQVAAFLEPLSAEPDRYRNVGMGKAENLWDCVNILTYMAHNFERIDQKRRIESGTFEWASSVLLNDRNVGTIVSAE